MNYKISGEPMPVVEFDLNKGESLYSQSGGMTWMSESVSMEANMSGGFMKGLGRVFGGESLFMVTYTAREQNSKIAFASTMPGEIHKLDISPSKEYIIQKQAFLCAEPTVELSTYWQKKAAAGLFGGEGFIMQKVSGSGSAFLELSGSIVEMELAAGEKIKVDTSHVAYFESACGYDVETVKGFKNVLFGGEGLFLTVLTGPGKVYLQTMTARDLAQKIIPYIPRQSSSPN